MASDFSSSAQNVLQQENIQQNQINNISHGIMTSRGKIFEKSDSLQFKGLQTKRSADQLSNQDASEYYGEEMDDKFFYSTGKIPQTLTEQQMNTSRSFVSNSNTLRQSNISATNSLNTSQINSSKVMPMQNLTAIVNQPVRDSLIKKFGRAVKNNIELKTSQFIQQSRRSGGAAAAIIGTLTGQGNRGQGNQARSMPNKKPYKLLNEKDIRDSSNIQKVYFNDFGLYIAKIDKLAQDYENKREEDKDLRIAQIQREIRYSQREHNPFDLVQASQRDNQDALNQAKINENLKGESKSFMSRGSQSKQKQAQTTAVPMEFYLDSYKLDRNFMRIQSHDEIQPIVEQYQKYLDLANGDLEISILKNFTFFNEQFHQFDQIKDDVNMVAAKTQSIRNANRNLKDLQLVSIIKLYTLQKKKANLAQVADTLKGLTALHQTVPVIENLILNSTGSLSNSTENYELGLQLISRANELIGQKAKGLVVADIYRRRMNNLKAQCCKGIEQSAVGQANKWLIYEQKMFTFAKVSDQDNKEKNSELGVNLLDDILGQIGEEKEGFGLSSFRKFFVDFVQNNWIFKQFYDKNGQLFDNTNKIYDGLPNLSLAFFESDEGNKTTIDFVSSISNVIGDNVDTLIRNLKLAHIDQLKAAYNRIFLSAAFQLKQILGKAQNEGVVMPSDIQQQVNMIVEQFSSSDESKNLQKSKQVLQLIHKCALQTLWVDLNPHYPINDLEMETDLNKKLKFGEEICYLLLSCLFLIIVCSHQMLRTIEIFELWISDSVRSWQQKQKDCEAYILLDSRDQKQIQRKHELVLSQITDQFQDQKEKIASFIQKSLNNYLAIIVQSSPSISISNVQGGKQSQNVDKETAMNSGLLKFLIYHLSMSQGTGGLAGSASVPFVKFAEEIEQHRMNMFFKICSIILRIQKYFQYQEVNSNISDQQNNLSLFKQSLKMIIYKQGNSVLKKEFIQTSFKILKLSGQIQSFENETITLQKLFVSGYGNQIYISLKKYLNQNEKSLRATDISKDDLIILYGLLGQKTDNLSDELHDSISIPFQQESPVIDIEYQDDPVAQFVQNLIDRQNHLIKQEDKISFKIMGIQLQLNHSLQKLISLSNLVDQQVFGDLAIKLMELIKLYNSDLKSIILGLQAVNLKMLDKVTAKHLCLAHNSIKFTFDILYPAVITNFIFKDLQKVKNDKQRLKLVCEDLQLDLLGHITELSAKFQSIIVEQSFKQLARDDTQWDKNVAKGEEIQVSKFIMDIVSTFGSMSKAITVNLSMSKDQLESDIILGALEQTMAKLENHYNDVALKHTSKIAKRRIRVDLKALMNNLYLDNQIQLSKKFIHLHFNLLISLPRNKVEHILQNNLKFPESNNNWSDCFDQFSKVKQSFKTILINRCGVKQTELTQFCDFLEDKRQEGAREEEVGKGQSPQGVMEEVKEMVKEEYVKASLFTQAIIESPQENMEEVKLEIKEELQGDVSPNKQEPMLNEEQQQVEVQDEETVKQEGVQSTSIEEINQISQQEEAKEEFPQVNEKDNDEGLDFGGEEEDGEDKKTVNPYS